MNQAPRGFREHIALVREYTRRAVGALSQSRTHAIASATLAGGYGVQLVFQVVFFLILTRMLGPERFGCFAAALAAINLLSPIAGIGFGEVALIRVSQDPKRSGLWATNALAVTAGMGLFVALCLALVSGMLDSDQWLDWHLMLGLAISELVLVRCCVVIARVHLARREIFHTSIINVSIAALKTVIALSLFLLGQTSLVALVILLDLCFSPLLLLLLASLARRTSSRSISWTHIRAELRLALSFATSVTCKAVYTDLDKLFLARWTSPYVVGTYAVGYKMLSLSFMPIRAILEATFPRQVQLADRDPKECLRFTTSLLFLNLALSGGIASLIFLLAPWATYVLGDDYQDSIGVLRLGFLLPVLQAVHYTLGNYITAIGHQSVRTIVQFCVLVTYVVAGVIVIPLYSWRGAIWTSLGCETLLVLLFGIGCLVLSLRHRNEVESRTTEQNGE